MSYDEDDRRREIEAKIAEFQSAGKPLVPAWLAKAIIDEHPLEIWGKDAEVARFCRAENTRREVLRHLGIEDEAETDPPESWEQAAANLRAHADELRRYQEQKT